MNNSVLEWHFNLTEKYNLIDKVFLLVDQWRLLGRRLPKESKKDFHHSGKSF